VSKLRRWTPGPSGQASDGLAHLPPPGLVVETVEVDGEALVAFAFPIERGAPDSLTDAEAAVVELVLQGLPTAQIATVRGVAKATVSSQLQSIYRKLGVTSRAELACKLG